MIERYTVRIMFKECMTVMDESKKERRDKYKENKAWLFAFIFFSGENEKISDKKVKRQDKYL